MRLLLYEGVPRRLRRDLAPHAVKTVGEMVCTGLENGELLAD